MLYQGENPKVQDTARMDPDRHKKAGKKEPMVSAPTVTAQQSPGETHQPTKHYNIFDTISHLQKQELRLIDP